MNTSLWIALFVAAGVALIFVLALRVLYRRSREVDKQIDFTKIRPLQDEEERD